VGTAGGSIGGRKDSEDQEGNEPGELQRPSLHGAFSLYPESNSLGPRCALTPAKSGARRALLCPRSTAGSPSRRTRQDPVETGFIRHRGGPLRRGRCRGPRAPPRAFGI